MKIKINIILKKRFLWLSMTALTAPPLPSLMIPLPSLMIGTVVVYDILVYDILVYCILVYRVVKA